MSERVENIAALRRVLKLLTAEELAKALAEHEEVIAMVQSELDSRA